MKIEESKHSIAELIDLYKRKDLTVNEEYQRAPRLWPPAARSYFIDTILSGFPFPKIYFWEQLNKATLRPQREIVDGQQRMMSIVDFRDGKFALGGNSVHFSSKKFNDLSEAEQETFLTYTVSCDVIRNAQRTEILQMFRRMNAYTLPLNDAEKRHSEFFGAFKTWVTQLVDKWGPLLSEWKVLTSRSIVRMEDAELIAEIALALKSGIVSSSNSQLRNLYEDFDTQFEYADEWGSRINETFSFIQSNLSTLQNSYITKSYVFLSLITALIHAKWGIPSIERETGIPPLGEFTNNLDVALEGLRTLASAHETKDTEGKYKDYVEACKAGSNRLKQRTVRFTYISMALRGGL